MAKKNIERARATTRRRAGGAAAAASTAANGDARTPTHDEITEAAYQRYLSRGGGHGSAFDDWLEAERELRARKTR